MEEDEDEILKQALLMSLAEQNEGTVETKSSTGAAGALSNNLAEDLVKSVGIDTTSKEVKEELEELKKTEKEDKKDDKSKKA